MKDIFDHETKVYHSFRKMQKNLIMPPTLKKLMGHIAFGACVGGCVRGWVRGSHFLYLL